ncbi:restriction endonuclease [Pseudoalteromonas sp. SCSIO 43210]
MDGYLQTGIGIAVSILLFWLSYRQTIGAKKERTKNANKSLHRAVMRRMVLEDYSPQYKDISRIIEGKAREFNTSSNDMLSEEQLLNSIYTEVFDSDLISPPQRVEIESRLDKLFNKIESKPSAPSVQEFKQMREENKRKRSSLALLTASVSMVGATTSVMYSYFKDPGSLIASNSEWLLSGVGVFIASFVTLTFLSIIRREKEEVITVSRNTSAISAVAFEIEVAKAIEKSGYHYKSEPRVGNHRPDFIIEAGGKNIAIDAKAWGDVVPLNSIKRTIYRLESMAKEEAIDSVYLVTKKPTPSKGFSNNDSNVKVVSMNEFVSILKNKQVA